MKPTIKTIQDVKSSKTISVLQILMDLSLQEGNYLDVNHESFKYSSSSYNNKFVEIIDGFKPIFRDNNSDIKVSVKNLKFDENHTNVSILIRREGNVTLPDNDYEFGNSIDSYIWRNYKIIKDGVINVKNLPLVLCELSYDVLFQQGVITEDFESGKTFVINIEDYPVANQELVEYSASDLFDLSFKLYKLKVKKKVLSSKIVKQETPSDFSNKFSSEALFFLKTYGVTENGFSPKMVNIEISDIPTTNSMEVKLAGLLSIPAIDAVEKAILSGKILTPAQKVMSVVIEDLDGCTDLVEEMFKTKKMINQLVKKIAIIKFDVILYSKRFVDMDLITETVHDIDFSIGKVIKCSINLTTSRA